MTLTFNRDTLLDALNVVHSAVEKKTTIPILASVLLEGQEDKVRITGTDIDRAISLTIEGQGGNALCLPATQFREVVKLASGEIQVSDQGIVTGEGFETRLPFTDRSAFPECPSVSGFGVKLNGKIFANMLSRVQIAVERDEHVNHKWNLQGVNLQLKDSQLQLAATNEKHLTVVTCPAPEIERSFLIPQLSIRALSIFAASNETVELGESQNHFGLIGESGHITSRLIVGEFPAILEYLPKEWKHVISIPKDQFISVVRHASLALDRNVGSRWEVSGKELTISARSSEKGESRRTLPVECPTLNGDPAVLGLNTPQVLAYLATTSDEVEFSFVDSSQPFRFRTKTEGFDYVYYSMAMRPDTF